MGETSDLAHQMVVPSAVGNDQEEGPYPNFHFAFAASSAFASAFPLPAAPVPILAQKSDNML